MKPFATTLIALAALLLGPRAHGEEPAVRRYALIIGANDGGAERVKLRYAASDAESFAKVLEQLGGVALDDRLLLLDPDRDALAAGFARLKTVMTAGKKGGRVELIVYYSGHSDEEGLLLGGAKLAYADLRKLIDGMPADVRIAVLDSCASGALTRRKGGTHRPPFLVDDATKVRGHAFLTSSSADEAAQESDRIAASFFTHFLVSGLRGAADVNTDGKVTLNEVYQFAFQETLARTEKTASGPQHPAYDIGLVGTGDLVMTDLRGTTAALAFSAEVTGRLYVRGEGGSLIAELKKIAGQPIELGLEPGKYSVTLEQGGAVYVAKVELLEGKRAELSPGAFRAASIEATVARGEAPLDGAAAEGAAAAPAEEAAAALTGEALPAPADAADRPESGYHLVPFNLSLVPSISVNGAVSQATGRGVLNLAGLGVYTRSARLTGVDLGIITSRVDEQLDGAQISAVSNVALGDAYGLQVAGVISGVGGYLRGAQVSGVLNGATGGARGLQVAGLANVVGRPASGRRPGAPEVRSPLLGFQVAGGGNLLVGDGLGVQASGGLNIARGAFDGAQISGGANVVTGASYTLQAAGGFNWADGDQRGLQVAGGFNWAGGDFTGLQAAGGFNSAHAVRGGQVGVINIGGDITGGQVGVVNIAKKVRGTQIGVINVSDEVEGLPIGVLSVIRKGRFDLELSTSDINPANVSLKMGGRALYTILTGGVAVRADTPRFSYGLGLGARLGGDRRLFADIDAVGSSFAVPGALGGTLPAVMTTLRLQAGLRLLPQLAVVGGPTFNALFTPAGSTLDFGGFGPAVELTDSSVKARLSPGFSVGVQF